MRLEILADTAIWPEAIYRNGKVILANEGDKDFAEYAKKIYQHLDIAYPKFFKMDNLCKLSFLASELLLEESVKREDIQGDRTAIILGNSTSSIATDLKHHSSYVDRENYYPSPAVFVYTLPNIMLGELCIRHKITGEGSCFMMENFNADFLFHYVQDLFINENYNYCITGWADYSSAGYNTELYLIGLNERNDVQRPFNIDFNKKNI